MSNTIKQVRGQLRQLVKELLPEILSTEIMAAIEKKLITQLTDGLNKIDNRQKDLQSYMVRSSIPVSPEKDKK